MPVPFPAPQFQEITTERRFPRLKLSHRCPLFHSGSAARGSGLRHAVPARRSLHPTTPRRRSSIRFTPHSTARKQNHSQPPRAIVSGTIGTDYRHASSVQFANPLIPILELDAGKNHQLKAAAPEARESWSSECPQQNRVTGRPATLGLSPTAQRKRSETERQTSPPPKDKRTDGLQRSLTAFRDPPPPRTWSSVPKLRETLPSSSKITLIKAKDGEGERAHPSALLPPADSHRPLASAAGTGRGSSSSPAWRRAALPPPGAATRLEGPGGGPVGAALRALRAPRRFMAGRGERRGRAESHGNRPRLRAAARPRGHGCLAAPAPPVPGRTLSAFNASLSLSASTRAPFAPNAQPWHGRASGFTRLCPSRALLGGGEVARWSDCWVSSLSWLHASR